jgi:hypothetical protein
MLRRLGLISGPIALFAVLSAASARGSGEAAYFAYAGAHR